MTLQVHGEPAYHQRQDADDSHKVQENRCVLHMPVVVDCEEDRIAGEGHEEADHDEGKAFSRDVG